MRGILVKPSSLLETFLRDPVPKFPMLFGLWYNERIEHVQLNGKEFMKTMSNLPHFWKPSSGTWFLGSPRFSDSVPDLHKTYLCLGTEIFT